MNWSFYALILGFASTFSWVTRTAFPIRWS